MSVRFQASGRVDYAWLEVAEGYLQFRMELGSGPALVRASVPVADGAWHDARLERRGATMRLTVCSVSKCFTFTNSYRCHYTHLKKNVTSHN